ncbi:MAG TPA: hypothetical protein DET40_05910 [Lentisphaeria bacterium]|nr:MAG: hypothetical protein A2X45_04415 [Lentisphaerae bacterium GWF2_50_93]HCE43063.1 hypothetical protein [Lentisphaeria bacterium]
MEFLKKHYEKIILAAFLLVFIISLVLLIVALNKSHDIREEDLKFPVKPPDYKKINPEDINYKKVLEVEKRWLPNAPRTEGDKDFTDLVVPYKVARCPSPECQKLIPRSCFVENGACPLCKWPLRELVSKKDSTQIDTNDNGIPDVLEKEIGLDPSDTSSGNKVDESGFTYLEKYTEFKSRKLPATEAARYLKDLKFHPPLAKRLYVDSIKRGYLPIILIKVTAHGDNIKTWTIQMDETMPGGAVKTRFYKVGAVLNLNERKYEIKGITSEVIEEKVDKRGSAMIRKTVYSISLQEEGDTPIIAVEKKPIPENKESVKIIDRFNDKEYFVASKESLTVGDAKTGEEKYTVKSVDNVKKKVILVRESDNTEYEIGMNEGEIKQDGVPPVNPMTPPGMMPPGMPGAMQPVMPPPGSVSRT